MVDLLKLVTVGAFIVVAIRRKIDLGIAMFVAAAAVGLMFGLRPAAVAREIVSSVLAADCLELAFALVLVMTLESILRHAGFLAGMTAALRRIVRDQRVVAASLPMLVGFLPSAGGALFSAPMVAEVMRDKPVSAEMKAFINYWFRHPMEFVGPVYAAVILSSRFLGMSIRTYVTHTFPLFVVAVASGAVVAFAGMPRDARQSADASRPAREDWVALANGVVPILATIVGVVAFKGNLVVVTGAVAILTAAYARLPLREAARYAKEAACSNVIILIAGVMAFKGVLDGSGAVAQLPGFFESVGMPSLLIAFALPFIVGFLTGYAPAWAGLALPMVAALGGSAAGQSSSLGLGMLAIVSGHVGVMLSPAHLCFLLTLAYFKADFGKVYRLVVIPEAVLLAAGLGYAVLLG